jgi:hypothetical protein
LRDPILKLVGSRRQRAKATARQLWIRLHEAEDPTHSRYADCLFQDAGNARVVGEITPNYCRVGRETFAEMAALSPRTRFIFIMRDPVVRLHSEVKHRLRLQGQEFARPEAVDAALRAILEDSSDYMYPYFGSRYDICLGNLTAAVPSAQIGIFFYENLFKPSEVTRVQHFLGLDPITFDGGVRVNAADSRESAVDTGLAAELRQALAPVYDYVAKHYPETAPSSWMW